MRGFASTEGSRRKLLALEIAQETRKRRAEARESRKARGPLVPEVIDPRAFSAKLPATGREVFTPVPLEADTLYELSLSGTYTSRRFGWFGDSWERADAFYVEDRAGNFTILHKALIINGHVVSDSKAVEWIRRDRQKHEYAFRFDGTGERLSLRVVSGSSGRGGLNLRFVRLEAPSLAERRAAELENALAARLEAQERERERESRARLAREEAEAEARLASKVDYLRRIVGRDSNVFDPEFREHFVRKRGKEILGEMGSRWRGFYDMVMKDRELVAVLPERAPEVIEWLELHREMRLSAERLAVVPPMPALVFLTPVPPGGVAKREADAIVRLL